MRRTHHSCCRSTKFVAVCCGTLRCVVVRCSVLQCILQCVAVRCSVLQWGVPIFCAVSRRARQFQEKCLVKMFAGFASKTTQIHRWGRFHSSHNRILPAISKISIADKTENTLTTFRHAFQVPKIEHVLEIGRRALLQGVAVVVCFSRLQCVVVCQCTLQWVVVCCSMLQSTLQWAALCCGVLQHTLQCVAVCCSVLQ